MLEDWEAFTSSIRKMVSKKKPPKRQGKVGSSHGGRNALQKRNKEARRASGNWSEEWWNQQDSKDKSMHASWRLMSPREIDRPTSFLDHENLGCTQRECKPNEIIIDEYRKMFESRISAGATEKIPGWETPHAKTVAWSYDMEGHTQKCVQRNCELANKKTEQVFKVSSPCLDDLHFKKEELESVGELSKVCSQIVLKCL